MHKTFCFLSLLALAARPHSVSAQSLADIAKAEEARRKAIHETAKVYTNDDLKDGGRSEAATAASGTPAAGASSSTEPAAKPDAGAGADTAKDGDKKDEKYWRDRITDARATVTRNKVLADALQSRINALTTDFVNTADPIQRAAVQVNRDTALAELARINLDIAAQTKAVTTIEEEARKAGVPAGWLR